MIDKKDCLGCEDNFYNGNNPFGVKKCWSFKTARIVDRIVVGHWERPPYKNKEIIKKPNCFLRKPGGPHYVSPDKITSEGYLK